LASVVNQDNLDLFWRFIYERHNVWHKRFVLEQPKPWTNDPVIANYRFTNVYRELDKGTIFLLDEVVPVDGTEPRYSVADMIFRIMVYRTFNHIPTWELLDEQGTRVTYSGWHLSWALSVVSAMAAEKERIFTNAHIVSPYSSMLGETKAEKVCHFLDILHGHLPGIVEQIQSKESLEKVFNYVKSLYGFGPFLAYELVVDFMYRNLIPFTEDDWANAGPGAMRGANLIYPYRRDYLNIMRELRDSQWQEFSRLFLPFIEIAYEGRTPDGHLTLRNIEHCLCEFQKYHRGHTGTGRPRNEFRSTSQGDAFWTRRLRG